MKLINDKLYLSKFIKTDICDEYIGWLNDKKLMQYSRQRLYNHTKLSCFNYLKSFENTDNLFLKIYSLENQTIGTLTAYINKKASIADMGILIGNTLFNKKGYGLSAWCLLQEYLFNDLKINKITAGTLNGNIGMIKIMERSGMIFQYEGKTNKKTNEKSYSELYYEKHIRKI